jgi:hypothetical protein
MPTEEDARVREHDHRSSNDPIYYRWTRTPLVEFAIRPRRHRHTGPTGT